MFAEFVTLASPRARLLGWLFATIVILAVPYAWLKKASLYNHIGLDWMPSIGLTRAYRLLLTGQWQEALVMNRLIVVVLLVGIPHLCIDAYKYAVIIFSRKSYSQSESQP